MKKVILLLAAMISILSCAKDQQKLATSPSGIITGRIYPIQAAARVNLSDQYGQVLVAKVSSLDGNFSFRELPEGKYLLSTPPHPIFSSINQIEVTLAKGQNANLGTIHLPELPPNMGLVVGKLLPVGFGKSITVIHMASGKQTMIIPNGQTGSFLGNLASGAYTISFQTIASVQPPPNLSIDIMGNRVDLGEQFCKPLHAASIKGKLVPAAAAAGITAMSTLGGPAITGVLDARTGEFIFPALDPGSYELSINTRVPYQSITPIKANLVNRQVLELGNITLAKDPTISFISYKVNDKPYLRYGQRCDFTAGVLSFSLSERYTSMADTKTWLTTTFSLAQPNITGPGKYTLSVSSGSTAGFEEKRSNHTVQLWDLQPPAAVGQLEITSLDPLTKTIKGTFSATLVHKSSLAQAHKIISEGSFSFNY